MLVADGAIVAMQAVPDAYGCRHLLLTCSESSTREDSSFSGNVFATFSRRSSRIRKKRFLCWGWWSVISFPTANKSLQTRFWAAGLKLLLLWLGDQGGNCQTQTRRMLGILKNVLLSRYRRCWFCCSGESHTAMFCLTRLYSFTTG